MVKMKATGQALWVYSNLWAGGWLEENSNYHFRTGPLSQLCSVQPRYSLSWSTLTRLEATSADHMVLGTTAARPSAVPVSTRCRSICDVTIMVSGLHEMALCEGMVYF